MGNYLMLRQCLTGANRYRFCREEDMHLIGTASALVLPDFPIRISCGELALEYSRDPDITLFPGINRAIFAGDLREIWGRVIWMGQGKHRLDTPFGTVCLLRKDDTYRFFRDDILIARMHPAKQDTFPLPAGSEWEPRLILAPEEPLPEPLATVLLAFPLLQIGI